MDINEIIVVLLFFLMGFIFHWIFNSIRKETKEIHVCRIKMSSKGLYRFTIADSNDNNIAVTAGAGKRTREEVLNIVKRLNKANIVFSNIEDRESN